MVIKINTHQFHECQCVDFHFGFFDLVGAPIEVEKTENPTEAQIEELHEKFTNSIMKLFEEDKHKYLSDPENAKLEIN